MVTNLGGWFTMATGNGNGGVVGGSDKPTTESVKISAAQQKLLADNGVNIWWTPLTKTQYGLREIARIADYSEQWLRAQLKAGTIASVRDDKGRYQVTKATLEQLRLEHAQKQLSRIERVKDGKKYQYKRPSQFAYDMVSKKLAEDTTLSAEQKALIKSRLDTYKVDWNKKYVEKKAKSAKKAKKATETK
jgi:AraC-like DNA-binding protein